MTPTIGSLVGLKNNLRTLINPKFAVALYEQHSISSLDIGKIEGSDIGFVLGVFGENISTMWIRILCKDGIGWTPVAFFIVLEK